MNTFYNCKELTMVTLKSINPVAIRFFDRHFTDSFVNTNLQVVYVPKVSIDAYKQSDWSRFKDKIKALTND